MSSGLGRDVRAQSIADEAEVGVSTLYHYFEDKDALLDWAILWAAGERPEADAALPLARPASLEERAVRPLTVALAEAVDDALGSGYGEQTLLDLVGALAEVNSARAGLLDLLEALARTDSMAAVAVRTTVERVVGRISRHLADGQARGVYAGDLDADVVAELLLVSSTFYARTWRTDLPVAGRGGSPPPLAMVARLARAVLRSG